MKNLLSVIIISILLVGCITDPEEKIVYRNIYTTVSVDKDDRLELLDCTWEWDDSYLSKLTVTGKAKNIGDYRLDYIKIYINAYNVRSELLSTDYGYLSPSSLEAGMVSTFSITDYDCPEKPYKVSIGYSYTVDVIIPPAKRAN